MLTLSVGPVNYENQTEWTQIFLLSGDSTPNNDISESGTADSEPAAVSQQQRPSIHDIQNQAIKTLFNAASPGGGTAGNNPVQVVTVKEAWAPPPPTKEEVVMRTRVVETSKNLNAINNNNSSGSSAVEELKRRSFHPQDYLSRVLDANEQRHSARTRRKQDFPKVRRKFGLLL